MDREALLSNIANWQDRIAEASRKWGGAQICAVTKTIGTDTINMAYDGGIRVIGENRVQELLEKKDTLDPRYEIQLIGSLQTNKVKYIIDIVDMIQSVDRIALAEEISRRAVAKDKVMPVLLQVNIAEEPQKGGVLLKDLDELLHTCAQLPGISVRGLMSIMPLVSDPEEVRPYFRRMRALFEEIRDRGEENITMDVLSMGMSGDCIVAAQEGATMVRLGRALFGERVYNNK